MNPKTFIQNITGSWLILTAAILPFPYAIFPSFKFAASDSILLYISALATLVIAIVLNSVLLFFAKVNQGQLIVLLKTICVFILAYFLLKYGVDKLFQNQFYTPEPNTLHTPIGQLTKDIVFWTSMGSSYGYNLFMGIIETVAALLLLLRKTRLIGLIASFGITLNILMINIGFDISVKFLSGYLVILTIFLLSFNFRLLYDVLILQTSSSNTFAPKSLNNSKFGKLVKGSIIGLLFLDCLIPFSQISSNEPSEIGLLGKSFDVHQTEDNAIWGNEIKSIHFHSKGYLITQNQNNEFEDYQIQTSPLRSTLYIIQEGVLINYKYQSDTIVLSTHDGETYKSVKLTQINNESLPLLKDTFHWTYEGFID